MSKKKPHTHTKTLDFELEGIEEAYKPDADGRWEPTESSKIEVDLPPELEEEEPPPELEAFEPKAKVWIFERRARGHWATLRRWVTGKAKR